MAVKVGELYVEMGLGMDQLNRDMASAQSTLQDFGSKMASLGAVMSAAITVPLVAFGKNVLTIGKEFEATMSEVAAISGAVGDELTALTEKAKQVGLTTKFSATDAGEAFSYMAQAGWQTEQMLEGIDGVMLLAAASGEELALSTNIVTNGLTAFGMAASESARFSDVMAMAANASNLSVSQLGASLDYVGPVAGAMGYSIEDTSVALGLMANQGIIAGSAGTALRAIITNLVKPTNQMQEAMDDLGISLTDSSGTIKPFDTLMRELRSTFDQLTPAQKTQYAATLAGKEGMSGLLAIVNASSEEFETLTERINDSAGAAQYAADIMGDNLAGDLDELDSAFEGLALAIYDAVVPALRSMVQAITPVMQAIAEWVQQHPELTKIAVAFAAVAAAIGPVTLAIGGVIKALPILQAGFAALTGPIGIVVAAITGLIAIFVKLYNSNQEFANNVNALWNHIKEVISGAISSISNALSGFAQNLFGAGSTAGQAFSQGVGNGIAALANQAMQIVAQLANNIIRTFNNILGIHSPATEGIDSGEYFVEGVEEGVDNKSSSLLKRIKKLAEDMKAELDKNLENLERLGSGIMDALKNKYEAAYNTVIDGLKAQSDAIKKAASEQADAIKDAAKEESDAAKKAAKERVDATKKAAKEQTELIKKAAKEQSDAMKKAAKDQSDAIKANGKATTDALKQSLKDQTKAVKEASEANIKQYKKEYDAKRKLIDSETDAAVKAIEDQIDAIDAQTEAEDEAIRLQEYNNKLAELNAKLATATAEEAAEIQEEINEMIADEERRLLLRSREEQKKALKAQIDAVKEAASAKKDALKEEEDAVIEAEKNKTEATLEALEKQMNAEIEAAEAATEAALKAHDERTEAAQKAFDEQTDAALKAHDEQTETALKAHDEQVEAAQKARDKETKALLDELDKQTEAKTAALDAQMDAEREAYEAQIEETKLRNEARQLLLAEDQDEILELLKTYNPYWQDAGQDLGDALLNGTLSSTEDMAGAVAAAIDLGPVIQEQKEKLASYEAQIEKLEEASNKAAGKSGGGGGGGGGLSGLGGAMGDLGAEAMAATAEIGAVDDGIGAFGDTVDSAAAEVSGAAEQMGSSFGGLQEKFPGISSAFSNMVASITSTAKNIGSDIWNTLTGEDFDIHGKLDIVKGLFAGLTDFIKTAMPDAVRIGLEAVGGIFDNIGTLWDSVGPPLIDKISRNWNAVWLEIQTVGQAALEALGAIWGGLVRLWDENGSKLLEAVRKTFELLWSLVKPGIEVVVSGVENIADALKSFWDIFGDEIIQTISLVFDTVSGAISGALDIIIGILDVFIGIFTGDFERMKEGVGRIIDGLVGLILQMFDTFTGAIGIFIDAIGSIFGIEDASTKVVDMLKNTWSDFITFLSDLWNGIKQLASDAWQAHIDFFAVDIPNALTSTIDAVRNFDITELGAKIGEAIDAAVNFVKELPGKIAEFLSEAWTKFKEWASNMLETAQTKGKEIVDAVVNFFKELPGKVNSFFTDLWDKTKTWAGNMLDTLKTKADEMVTAVVTFFKELPGKTKETLTDTWNNVKQWASDMLSTLKEKAKEMIDTTVNFFKELPGKVKTETTTVLTNIKTWLGEMITTAKTKIAEFVSGVMTGLEELPGKVKDLGRRVVEGVWEGIKGAMSWLGGKIGEFCSGVIEGFKSGFDINSPAKKMIPIGLSVDEGLGQGIDEGEHFVTDAMDDITNAITDNEIEAPEIGFIGQIESMFADALNLAKNFGEQFVEALADSLSNRANDIAGALESLLPSSLAIPALESGEIFKAANTASKGLSSLQYGEEVLTQQQHAQAARQRDNAQTEPTVQVNTTVHFDRAMLYDDRMIDLVADRVSSAINSKVQTAIRSRG